LLLEKRVKSRFSQRIYRVVSPLSTNVPDAWKAVVRQALVPESVISQAEPSAVDRMWLIKWESQVDVSRFTSGPVHTDTMLQAVLGDEAVDKAARRMCELSTDVRILLRPFVSDTTGIAVRY
jgi:origin recognition complex subunit 4